MSKTTQALQYQNLSLRMAYGKILKDHRKLQEDHMRLTEANQFKWIILIASLGVSSLSLGLSIWSTVDNDMPGLSQTGIALSGISLGLSLLGVFTNNLCKVNSHREAQTELDEKEVDRESITVAI